MPLFIAQFRVTDVFEGAVYTTAYFNNRFVWLVGLTLQS